MVLGNVADAWQHNNSGKYKIIYILLIIALG